MSDAAIAAASETLLGVLAGATQGLVARDHVLLGTPGDERADAQPSLRLFLYEVTENVQLRNLAPARTGPETLTPPPSLVDLHYLVVPYADARDDEQKVLGRVIQAFAARPVLRGPALKGVLAGTDQELRVVSHQLSMEELLRLWNTFSSKPFKVSLGYQVTPVRIDSSLAPIDVQPVLERHLRVSGT